MKFMTRLCLSAAVSVGLCAAPAFAQEATPDTPEIDPYALYDAVKNAAEGNDVPALITPDTEIEPAAPEIEPDLEAEPSAEPESIPAETAKTPAPEGDAIEDELDEDELDEGELDIEAPEPEAASDDKIKTAALPAAALPAAALPAIDNPDANIVDAPILNRDDIAPYFLSAREYLKRRGDAPAPQTELIYEVSQSGLFPDAEVNTIEVALAVGTDYVARQSTLPGSTLKIYDFKYNRLITINQPSEDSPSIMLSKPLYGMAHRNTRTVATSSNNGKSETVEIGPDVTLDTFWIESAMSWAMTARPDDVILDSGSDNAKLSYKGSEVFTVASRDASWPDPLQSDALLAFAHWDLPIHPAGLKQLYAAAPIEHMTIVSKSPGAPDGQKQVWKLKSARDSEAVFPLPDDAINALTHTQTDPIAFVMDLAARGAAPGGRPEYDDLAEAVLTAMDADDFEAAWLAAKRYELYSRPCKKNNIRKACKALREIEDMRKKPESLDILLEAYADSENAKRRVKALTALKPWLAKEDTPVDIIRLAGVMRAKIDSSTATVAGLDDINAGVLLKSALIKDPYNSQTYLAMAQYFAATGDYDAAWNVFDALRSSVSDDDKTKFAVDKVESGLQDRAPGYFIPAVMAER